MTGTLRVSSIRLSDLAPRSHNCDHCSEINFALNGGLQNPMLAAIPCRLKSEKNHLVFSTVLRVLHMASARKEGKMRVQICLCFPRA